MTEYHDGVITAAGQETLDGIIEGLDNAIRDSRGSAWKPTLDIVVGAAREVRTEIREDVEGLVGEFAEWLFADDPRDEDGNQVFRRPTNPADMKWSDWAALARRFLDERDE